MARLLARLDAEGVLGAPRGPDALRRVACEPGLSDAEWLDLARKRLAAVSRELGSPALHLLEVEPHFDLPPRPATLEKWLAGEFSEAP
jgi:hypothetical protein